MQLRYLSLERFRTYQHTRVAFTATVSVLVGRNAAGKSNLLEALMLLSTTRSLRARVESQLIARGSDSARIEAGLTLEGRAQELLCFLDARSGRTKKLWRLQGAPKTSRAVVGLLTTCLFKPEDVDTLQKSSAARRAVLDQLLVVRNPEFFMTLQRLRGTLLQRQRLLEQARAGQRDGLDAYDEPLVQDGARVSLARARLVATLTEQFTESVRAISGASKTTQAALTLTTPATNTLPTTLEQWIALYRSQIAALREREVAAARNLVGPHREDLVLTVNTIALREYGSRGEWRSAVLGLLLASCTYLEQLTGERPLLLLDDVFSELDPARRAALLPYLTQQQTLITTADVGEVPPELLQQAQLFTIADGTITPKAKTHAFAA